MCTFISDTVSGQKNPNQSCHSGGVGWGGKHFSMAVVEIKYNVEETGGTRKLW